MMCSFPHSIGLCVVRVFANSLVFLSLAGTSYGIYMAVDNTESIVHRKNFHEAFSEGIEGLKLFLASFQVRIHVCRVVVLVSQFGVQIGNMSRFDVQISNRSQFTVQISDVSRLVSQFTVQISDVSRLVSRLVISPNLLSRLVMCPDWRPYYHCVPSGSRGHHGS